MAQVDNTSFLGYDFITQTKVRKFMKFGDKLEQENK